MRLIGLSGYARTGKDTVGKLLVERHGFTRVAFADKLREVALACNPIVRVPCVPDSMKDPEPLRLADVVTAIGWEGAKELDEVRGFLQRLGTEGGRNILGDNVWVDAVMWDLDLSVEAIHYIQQRYVFTDCRFPNEAQAIKDWGGEVWRIERAGYVATNNHASETALDGWEFDRTIRNDSDVDDLAYMVAAIL